MRICILSRNPASYSSKRLLAAAQKRGHGVLLVDYLRCGLDLTDKVPRVTYGGSPVSGVNVVLPRVASGTEAAYGVAVVRQFEAAGVCAANASQAIARAGDKLCALQLLARAGIAVPRTAFAHAIADKDLLIKQVGGPPLVLKLTQGSQGVGVMLARTRKAVEKMIADLQAHGANFLLQEFIAESAGRDLRVIVVGGKVVAAMERRAAHGDFRSNLHRGGKAVAAKLSTAERRIAVRAAKALELDIAGVDIVRSIRGPLVLEVNASPGLEGIESACKIDVADAVVRHLQRRVKERT